MLTRTLWALSVAFAILAASFFAWHLANKRLFSEYVRRVDAGRTYEASARFDYYIQYVARNIKNPRRDELRPWWVRAYYDFNPLHPGAADVIRWGSDYRGGCGSHSYVLIALLKNHGIEARPLFILDDAGHSIHTVVEAHLGGRWVVGDPSFGITYRRRDGQLATKEELGADPALFLAQTRSVPGYNPEYNYDAWTLLNWRKVPVVLPAIHSVAVRLVGLERVKEIARPAIWMMPRTFYTTFCAVMAVALGGTAVMVARRRGRGNRRAASDPASRAALIARF